MAGADHLWTFRGLRVPLARLSREPPLSERVRSINPTGKRSCARSCAFAPRHLPVVALMIVAAQMQYAVQNKNLDFLRGGMAERARVLRRNLGGNGNFAGKLFARIVAAPRETKARRWLYLFPESAGSAISSPHSKSRAHRPVPSSRRLAARAP